MSVLLIHKVCGMPVERFLTAQHAHYYWKEKLVHDKFEIKDEHGLTHANYPPQGYPKWCSCGIDRLTGGL